MIALTKSGYKKFIEGTLHISTDVKVAVLATGITNNTFTTSNVNTYRSSANTNLPEYSIDDFSLNYIPYSNELLVRGQVNIDTMDFVAGGDTPIGKQAAVIDTTDNDDVIGMIFLYQDADPITYSALNSAPVNIDYRVGGMSKLQFKNRYNQVAARYKILGGSTSTNYADTFPQSFTKLPIFDSTVTSNMLTDLKIALLSSTTGDTSTVFRQQMFNDSKTLSSLDSMDSSSSYHYVSGGYTFRNLGIGSTYACLTATDSTIYIPGLTENNSRFFAVVYFEDTSMAGNDVMSDVYKQNSYILSTIQNLDVTDIRFPFKQSVIIDAFFLNGAVFSDREQSGILALNNVVGPGFTNSNLNNDFAT